METKTIKVYQFEELEENIKEKVLEKFRTQNDYIFLEENLNEHLNEILKENKIEILNDLKLRYSLSYSQGDGVSFIGLFKWKDFLIKIETGHLSNYYSHSLTTDINIFKDDEEGTEADEKSENDFKEIYFNICDKIEKIGYECIEEEDSDESIKGNIKANEYTFRENGEIEII